MSKRAFIICAILLAIPTGPSVAAYSDLQVSVIGFGDTHVTLSLRNPNPAPETGRVQLVVTYDDGTQQTLTTSNVTVDGGTTASITVTGAHAIVAIGDDPQPIPAAS